MKITLCGSIAFHDEMALTKKELEKLGHQVKLPPFEVKDEKGNMIPVKKYYTLRKETTTDTGWIWDRKEEAMRWHLDKITWSDAILVLNYEKNNIPGYIGANTLLEMGIAFYLNKKIFLWDKIPEIAYKEEILGMKPIAIKKNLKIIN
jgi:hypothetical protein